MISKIFSVSKIKSFYEKYESLIGAATVLLGFVFDNLTLRGATIYSQTLVFAIYLFLAGLCIFLLNFLEVKEEGTASYPKLHFWVFLLLQFALGSLFSMFFVFYSRGVALSTSWPFLALLLFNMIGSELFKKHYGRVSLQISLLFVATFSFYIYLLPVVFHRIGSGIFVASGVAALGFVAVFVNILKIVAKKRVVEFRKRMILGVSISFVLFNAFYFFNIIPPVPLVMKDGGVYHALSINGSEYLVLRESTSFLQGIKDIFGYQKFHYSPGDSVYVVTAVYSPADLDTDIIHDWQYYDDAKKAWTSSSKIRVPIIGGREEGYRLYSVKRGVFPGLWRVNVVTHDGRIVGRIKFEIVNNGESYSTVSDTI